MKFSEINREEWPALRPYLDTCLLPVTGMTGEEEPWEVTRKLEKLRDMMDLLEAPYRGRIVTYPAVHYLLDHMGNSNYINQLVIRIKKNGFKFVIIVILVEDFIQSEVDTADLIFQYNADESILRREVSERVELLWKKQANLT
jgi:23S rRNA (pseudouridine1915-N3)-methyltransferase